MGPAPFLVSNHLKTVPLPAGMTPASPDVMMTKAIRTMLVGLAGLAGCGADVEREPGLARTPVVTDNGRTLNGRTLNGRTLNGVSFNGRTLNGRTLNGRTLNGRTLNGRTLNGRTLNGRTLNGVALDGSRLVALLDDGTLIDASELIEATGPIDLIAELGAGLDPASGASLEPLLVTVRIEGDWDPPATELSGEDIHSYWVSFSLDSESWEPLCAREGLVVGAIPLAGRWNYEEGTPGGGSKMDDPTSFTFACEGYALAKCTRLGYRPWASVPACPGRGCPEVSLESYHQTCTRVLRADYCGDGTSYTVDGTRINVFDGIDVQADTEDWELRGEWDATGLRCMNRAALERIGLEPASPGKGRNLIPGRAPNLPIACAERFLTTWQGCGAPGNFRSAGTLLMTEANPDLLP